MEIILIATDFSVASRNATMYGLQLARLLQAKVILIHVCQPMLSAADTVVVTPEDLKKGCEDVLRKEVDQLKKNSPVDINCVVEEGIPSEVIIEAAAHFHAKWLIAGMKGHGKTVRKLFGSVALLLSRKTKAPLIVVPEEAVFTIPKTIALASDINYDTDIHLLDPLEELGIKFDSTMYVVRVIKKRMDETIERLLRPSRIKWHYKDLHPSFEFVSDKNLVHAINEFVKEHQVNIVAMIAKEHNLFERLFTKSDIKDMLLHAHVPVIILPAKADASATKELDESVAKGHA
jgi:nucleotide-binding universal stress UspA family protein